MPIAWLLRVTLRGKHYRVEVRQSATAPYQDHTAKEIVARKMCFDIGIVTCGPNEALVISGMCQVNYFIFIGKYYKLAILVW